MRQIKLPDISVDEPVYDRLLEMANGDLKAFLREEITGLITRTSEEWLRTTNYKVISREGWEGKSWKESITWKEFERRLMLSTIEFRK